MGERGGFVTRTEDAEGTFFRPRGGDEKIEQDGLLKNRAKKKKY